MNSAESSITDIETYMNKLGAQARVASREISSASTGDKNKALLAIAAAINSSRASLMEANKKDLEAGSEQGLESALMDRLELSDARIDIMIEGLHQVAALDDPVGEVSDLKYRPSGIQVG